MTKPDFRVDQPPTHGGDEFETEILLGHPRYMVFKRGMDLLISVVLTPFAALAVAMGALAIKLTSRGPVFYSQTRLGKDGRVFRVVKLRSMVHNAEAHSGPTWTKRHDSRITPVGWILRETHIDELPQLLNVFRGEMSLIGPRPERPEIVEELEWQVPHYRQRLKVLPGIAGLAQSKLPPDTDVQGVRRKLLYDLYYVRHATFWLDMKIYAYTAGIFLGSFVKAIVRPFLLPASHGIESSVLDMLAGPEDTIAVGSDPLFSNPCQSDIDTMMEDTHVLRVDVTTQSPIASGSTVGLSAG